MLHSYSTTSDSCHRHYHACDSQKYKAEAYDHGIALSSCTASESRAFASTQGPLEHPEIICMFVLPSDMELTGNQQNLRE